MRARDKYDIRAEIILETIENGFKKLGYASTIIEKIEREVVDSFDGTIGLNDIFTFIIKNNTYKGAIYLNIEQVDKYYRMPDHRLLPLFFNMMPIKIYNKFVLVKKHVVVNPGEFVRTSKSSMFFINKYHKPYYKDIKNLRKINRLNIFLKNTPLNMSIIEYDFYAFGGDGGAVTIFLKRDLLDDLIMQIDIDEIKNKENMLTIYYDKYKHLGLGTYSDFKNNMLFFKENYELIDY